MRERVLLCGAGGYLGRRVSLRAARSFEVFSGFSAHPERVVAGQPIPLDFRDLEGAAETLRSLRPRVIINASAINPGGPEDEMEGVNHLGPRNLAPLARDLKARWIQVSTDVVHDGRRAPYTDDTPPSPIGMYARSKAAAERALLEEIEDVAVVRTSLIYSLEEMDRGTAGFASRLAAGEPLRLFTDVLRQPVWVETLATALVELATSDYCGFLNVAGDEVLSREAFGRRMLEFWGVRELDSIEPVRAAELGLEVPLDLRLRLDRAREALRCPLPGVSEVIERGRGL